MARLIGPDEAVRTVFLTSGSNKGKASAQGMSVPLYADLALSVPADVRSTTDAVIQGTPPTLTVDAYSMIPLFKFPDGVDIVYTSIGGGPPVALYARADERIDDLNTRVVSVETGGAGDALLVHKSGAETVAGVKTFSASPLVPTPTTASQAAPKAYVDATATAAVAPVVAQLPSMTVYETQAMHSRKVLYQRNSTLYAANQSGTATVFRSDDFGATWTAKGNLAGDPRTLMRVEATGTLIAVTTTAAVYRSIDDGVNWTLITTLNFAPLSGGGISETPSGYILIGEYGNVGNTVYRMMRSTNDGVSFTATLSSLGTDPQGDPGHLHSVTYDPYENCFVVFMDRPNPDIWRSNDEGATWTKFGSATDPMHPNFVSPMYFADYVGWGPDNQIGGAISRIKRADFYAGNFGAYEVVARVNHKAGYYTMPLRDDLWMLACATEVIGVDPLSPGSYGQEVYLVSGNGRVVTGGAESIVPQTVVGDLPGLKPFFPAYHFNTLDHSGRAWINFPSVTGAYGYTAMPITAGWSPPVRRTEPMLLPMASGFRKIGSGRYYGPGPHTPSTGANGAGLLMAIPFWVPEAFLADRIACEVTTAAASSTVRLGIYDSSLLDQPNAVVLDAGTVDASTTGVKEITISQVLRPGLYWLAAVPQGGNPTLRSLGNSSLPPVSADTFVGTSGSTGVNCWYRTGINGALSAWSGGSASPGGYKVMVRAA